MARNEYIIKVIKLKRTKNRLSDNVFLMIFDIACRNQNIILASFIRIHHNYFSLFFFFLYVRIYKLYVYLKTCSDV